MTEQHNGLPEWNLKDFYASIEAPEVAADIAKLESYVKSFSGKYNSKIAGLSGDELATAISEYEVITEIAGKLGSYADLNFTVAMDKPEVASFYQNTSEKINEIYTGLLFFTLDLNKIDEAAMKEKFSSSKLKKYAPWIRDVRVMKPYQLSDEVEKTLHEKYVTGKQAWVRLFDETLSGLKFKIDGKQLTTDEAFNLLSDKDEAKRKKAAKVISKVLGGNIKTFALISNTLAKDKQIEDKWRGFKKPISSRNVANFIEDNVTDELIKTVRANYENLAHRYYVYKAKMFGKEKLNYWDRNAPLPLDVDRKYSWDEATELVLSAYKAFSPTIANIGKDFFDKGWIDAAPHAGKASGAFAHPTVPSVHPYLLLNFHGKARDVMTLAHELGHGVHQVLAKEQGALMADTPLTLAETASVFGEQLTFRELLRREGDPDKKKILIASKVEDMLNTVVRQIAFCEFEVKLHDARKKGELSPDEIGKIWMSVQKKSLGPGIKFTKDYNVYWSYISHFIHSPFYVYAYAFGDLLVNALYGVYQKGHPNFEEKYINMLKAGGTLHHRDLLAPFGLDASKPDFWQTGVNVISGLIDELGA